MLIAGRGVVRGAVGIAAVVLAAVSCGPPEKVKEPDLSAEDVMGARDENVDVAKAKSHIEAAVAALRDDELDKARRELDRAEPFADELKREEIRRVRQSVDEVEANKSIPAVNKLAASGQCEKAIDKALAASDARRQTTIPTFIKKGTSGQILDCLLDQLAVDLSIAREIGESKNTKRALVKSDFQKLTTKVTDATVKELIGRFEEPLAEREWEKAKTLLDELVARKEAGDNEYNRIMGIIREGIANDVKEQIADALDGDDDVADKLEAVDALIAAAEWGKKKGSSVGAAAMPDDVRTGRDQLALWAVCKSVRCSLSSTQQVWTYGDVALTPTLDPRKGKAVATIEHGTKLWRIATSSGWALVAKKDPGSLDGVAGRVKVAAGWIKAGGVKRKDTREMLPPGESIIGTRVWGLLRDGQKSWELGKVIRVNKGDVAVERIADFSIVTVKRSAIRFGTLTKGTKVFARCKHPLNLEAAVIDKVTFPKKGDAIATVTCLDAKGGRSTLTRKEQIGALRSKPAWLPARK